jgi:hypothetical protein
MLRGRSSTDSLRSSIYKGVVENGRTYHCYKQGSEFARCFLSTTCIFYSDTYTLVEYPLPNDEVRE